MKELLKRIAGRLTGMFISDMTQAEFQIADMLVAEGYLVKKEDEGGEEYTYELKSKN